MTTYYISGPMRGKPNYNRDQFNEVEAALRDHLTMQNGRALHEHTVINPIKNFGGDLSLEPSEYLTLDLKQVLDSDVIVQLPGWQASEGANREANLGVWTSKRFMLAIDQDAEYVEAGYNRPDPSLGWEFSEIESPEFSVSVRAQACDTGKQLITGDRNNDYGPPWQDFARTSGAMTAYGYRHTRLLAGEPTCPTCGARPLESHDTAIMVDCVKTSRIMWSPTKLDHWHDKIGYSACGAECALHDESVRLGKA